MSEQTRGASATQKARIASLIILLLAIVVSAYLSYLKFAPDREAVCLESGKFDCGTVLNSFYSEIQGVPIAWLGLAANLVMTAILLFESRNAFMTRYGVALVFGISLFTFLFSVYLVYVQAFLIRAYCPWCLSHEVFMTILFGLAIWRITKWDMTQS